MLYDISPAISPRLQVWPGDTPPSREILMDMARGDSLTLCTLHSTVHAGAHADAPSHYGRGHPSIDARSLDFYLGRCQVLRLPVPRGHCITSADLPGPARAERILLSTGTFPDPQVFNEDFAACTAGLVESLGSAGVRLIGIDTPSIDPFASKGLPAHAACLRNDLAILEGVMLGEVPEGIYELIALPLKLVGFDASPVRAVLRTVSPAS
ncbi:MAG: cyclase family protein [Acidobacteriota bacterium]